jgi:hypothetical protein
MMTMCYIMKNKCNDIAKQNLFSMLSEKIKLTFYHCTKFKIMWEELRVIAKDTEKGHCTTDFESMQNYRV